MRCKSAALLNSPISPRDCDGFDDYKASVERGGFFRIHWCGSAACETHIREETRSTIRCIPFDAPEEPGACIVCNAPSPRRVIAAQAY